MWLWQRDGFGIGSEQTRAQSLRCYRPEEFAEIAGRAEMTVTNMVGLGSASGRGRARGR